MKFCYLLLCCRADVVIVVVGGSLAGECRLGAGRELDDSEEEQRRREAEEDDEEMLAALFYRSWRADGPEAARWAT
jgi:hypothetical protein